MKREEIERRALLADSGEAVLSPREREAVASWVRDMERLGDAARAAFAEPALTVFEVQAVRRMAERCRRRARRRLLLWRMAAAASLAVLTWSGWTDLQAHRESQRLARLEAVLALLGTELPENGGDTTSAALAERLLRLQDGEVQPEG